MHTHTHTHTHTHGHTYTYMCIHTHTLAHTHLKTHTHKCVWPSKSEQKLKSLSWCGTLASYFPVLHTLMCWGPKNIYEGGIYKDLSTNNLCVDVLESCNVIQHAHANTCAHTHTHTHTHALMATTILVTPIFLPYFPHFVQNSCNLSTPVFALTIHLTCNNRWVLKNTESLSFFFHL